MEITDKLLREIKTLLGDKVRDIEISDYTILGLIDIANGQFDYYCNLINFNHDTEPLQYHWVRQYAFGLCLETLGLVYCKYDGILTVTDGKPRLNYNFYFERGELIKQQLINELKNNNN